MSKLALCSKVHIHWHFSAFDCRLIAKDRPGRVDTLLLASSKNNTPCRGVWCICHHINFQSAIAPVLNPLRLAMISEPRPEFFQNSGIAP